MVVRIVSYAAESIDGAKRWAEKRADDARNAPGVEHAYFFLREKPAEAGAVILYSSEEALREYKNSDAYQSMVDEIARSWGESGEPVTEEVYELLDV